MNDFTKEELQYLSACTYERPHCVTPEMKMMSNKLQSLIDNYCEHEPLHNLSRGECLHCDKNLCHECGSEI